LRILGIDPGSQATGYGILECAGGGRLVHVAHGTLRPPRSASPAARLQYLYRELSFVIEAHRPDAAVAERVFVASSPAAALVLGQARGAVLAAAGAAGLPVREYAASEIKRAVASSGRAAKAQVQHMVRRLLGLPRAPARDAADALAAAICHAHAARLADLGVGSRRRSAPRRGLRVRVRPVR